MQASRRVVNEANNGAGAQVEAILEVPTSPREEINFHNIWMGVSCEPQNTGANAQGSWVLYIIRENAPSVTWTDATFNGETANQQIIACGVWSASNESVFTLPPTQIKTSRNLQAGDKMVLAVITTGISAGLASNRAMLCAHVVRK